MIAKKTASARPRSWMGNAETTIASEAGNMSAAKTPWTTRKKINHGSASAPVGVAPQSAEAVAKPTTPTSTIRRCPSTSESLPPKANSADSASR